tara:strand:+ start:3300 stop:4559 length:1260 start_codon:yes stop_codon:yes gene_type:complete
MTRADITDGLKSLAIITLFLVIIGLILISTHPERFTEFLFFWRSNNNIREGNTNINTIPAECQKCVISPTIGPASGITNIDAVISQNQQVDISNILPRKGGSFNLYISPLDMSYVFCSWSQMDNSSDSDWLKKCNEYMYSDDISCCHGSTSVFYQNNYITDVDSGEIYKGLVFKYDISSTALVKSGIGDQMVSRSLYNFTPVVPDSSLTDISFIRGRFKYTTTITSDNKSSLIIGERVEDDSVTVDNLINCEGVRVPPPIVTSPDLSEMPVSDSLLNGSTTGSTSGSTIQPSNFGKTTTENISTEVQGQLKSAVDSLVKQFETKINSMNIASNINNSSNQNQLEYPNIGKPTYLNIGSCNNNSPYVYNSGCSSKSGKGTESGKGTGTGSGFLNQYKCYPSMTGEFQDCGPEGYNSLPQF